MSHKLPPAAVGNQANNQANGFPCPCASRLPQADDEVRAVVGDVYSAAKAQAASAGGAYTGDDDIIDSQVRGGAAHGVWRVAWWLKARACQPSGLAEMSCCCAGYA